MTSRKELFSIRRIAELEKQLKQRDERIAALEKQVAELIKPYSCIKFPMIFRNKSFGCKISMAKHFLVFFLDVTIGEI